MFLTVLLKFLFSIQFIYCDSNVDSIEARLIQRFDILFAELKAGMHKLSTENLDLKSDINLLANENLDLKSNMNKLANENLELKSVTEMLKFENKELKSECSVLSKKLTEMEHSVSLYSNATLKGKRVIPVGSNQFQIAFHANIRGNFAVTDHQIIPFETVKLNVGNAYEGHFGYFESPLPGYYIFFAHLLTMPNKFIQAEMVKNGVRIQVVYAGNSDNYFGPGSNQAIVHLGKGDKVWVKVDGAQHSGGTLLDNEWCTFAGFLLYPDV